MDKVCQYRFRDGTLCNGLLDVNSKDCFWHNPSAIKTGPEIKCLIEQTFKERKQLEGFQLERADLNDVDLVQANLHNANLKRANLSNAHLYGSDLSNANLFKATLDKANLKESNLENANLIGTNFGEANMERIRLGQKNLVINEFEGNLLAKMGDQEEALKKYSEAEGIYRRIKNNFKNRGLSYEAGQYHYREMVVARKQSPLYSLDRLYSLAWDLTTAYGESPHRIFVFSAAYICIFSILYSIIGVKEIVKGDIYQFSSGNSAIENLNAFGHALYYSMATFTTVGCNDLTMVGIGKAFAMMEAYSGPFLTALFVITVYKRFMER